ncbi:hypothetical protein [Paenarthrobacter sp. NPDC090522]|uniref:hypothetical protein n=1 Tax=Paenarthrobacter sp. NPDC090522 TaxID=3364383 RepID=UPI003807EF67
MSAMDILGLFRLKNAPWLSLVTSGVAWFALWGILHEITVTSAVGQFLLALGLPSGVERGTLEVHNWIVGVPRVTWFCWGAVILAAAAGAQYVRAVYNQRESLRELLDAGRHLGRAKARPVTNWMTSETGEMHALGLEAARADYSKAATYDQELRTFEQQVQLRCAAVYWLIAVILVELKDTTPPDLVIFWRTESFAMVMTLAGAATLIALCMTCATQRFHDPTFKSPTTADKFKQTLLSLLLEVLLLILNLALVLAALPLFVLGILLYPDLSAKKDAEPD